MRHETPDFADTVPDPRPDAGAPEPARPQPAPHELSGREPALRGLAPDEPARDERVLPAPSDAASPRPAPWRRSELHLAVLAGIAIAACVIVGWLVAAPRARPAAEVLGAAQPAQRSPSPGGHAASERSAGLARQVSASASGPSDVDAAGAKPPPGQAEVCGLGWLPADASGSPELSPEWEEQARRADARLAAHLARSNDPRARVAGLLLQARADIRAGADEAYASITGCNESCACLKEADRLQVDAMRRAAAPSAGAMATLAAGSRDPVVYAGAVRACGSFGAAAGDLGGACQLISVAQWARLDADNAVPWLHVAAAAAERRDGPGLDEAMHRVALATTSRSHAEALTGVAIEQAPADVDAFERAHMSLAAARIGIDWQLPAYQTLTRYCDAAAVRDANRMQTCDAIARGFIDHPSSATEWGLGLRVGERLGWPADRLATLHEQRDAMTAAMHLAFADPNVHSCASTARARAFWLDAAKRGEYAAARALIAASGQTVAELAAQERVRFEEARRSAQAEQAASASAASAAALASPYSAALPPTR